MPLERAGQSLLGAVSFRRLSEQTRSIHIPRRIISPSSPTNLVHRTRTLLTQLITQFRAQSVPFPHFTHSPPSIRQSLSLPVRIALSRPLRAPCLPRAPRIPGNVTHVGLGTSRNFSTSQPIFQHIAQNVPVAGRTSYEVDWDLRLREKKYLKIRRPKMDQKVKVAHKLAPLPKSISAPMYRLQIRRPKMDQKVKVAHKLAPLPKSISAPISATMDEEAQHYFMSPSEPLVTTFLQIPLAPTPTSRVPLSPYPSPRDLLPLPEIAKEHASHSKHAIRVSSLFRRLDAARVWERRVFCETFGDPSGLCTILRIKFEGWTEDEVRNILGDAGRDWCTIQELRLVSEVNSGTQDSICSPTHTASSAPVDQMAFVMPRLDFSSSFTAANSPPSSGSSLASSLCSFSDGASDYSNPSIPESWDENHITDTSSFDDSSSAPDTWSSMAYNFPTLGWLGFSSDFARRASY